MSKTKMKELKKAMGSSDIGSLFEEMMGMKDADPEIIIPKFVEVRNFVRKTCLVLNQFSKLLSKDFPEYSKGLDEISAYSDKIVASTNVNLTCEDYTENYFDKITQVEINQFYSKLKSNPEVKNLIVLGAKLKPYKNNFIDVKNLKLNFINNEPGLSWCILNFSSLDFKQLWANDNVSIAIKRFILMVLAKLFEFSSSIYSIITSPDVDVEKFTSLLMSSIAELKKQPKLHRCQAAFKRIENSVELLKNKFSNYYRESVASENPDMIVTSFIVDVSNQGGASATLTREFRIIIQYMHEMSQKSGKSKDPNVKKIFDMLNSNFSAMEQKTTPGESTNFTDSTDQKEPANNADPTNFTDQKETANNADSTDQKGTRE